MVAWVNEVLERVEGHFDEVLEEDEIFEIGWGVLVLAMLNYIRKRARTSQRRAS